MVGVSELLVTVMLLLKGPEAAALKVALITPVFPGATGVLVYSGVVQPQVGFTSESITGALPVFVKTNSVVTGVPCGIFPKLWVSSLNFITPCAKPAPSATRKKTGIKISFFTV